MRSKKVLMYIFNIIILVIHLSCAAQSIKCKQLKYLQVYKDKGENTDNGSSTHIEILYEKDLNNEFYTDDRTLLKKMNLNKEERIGVLQEYLCFQGKNELSDKNYSNKFGRSENRIKLAKENIKYPIEVEALYSLTSLLFDESVAISPVIINITTGENCNFQRKDLDVVYEIYKDWFNKMKKEGFDNITWPLKNSNYMWLGEDVVDDIETLIRKEI